MIEAPEVAVSPEQVTAAIHLIVARSEIQNVMGPAIQEIFATLTAQDVRPAGPWFTRHLRRPTDTFDFEVSVPVSRQLTPVGRVRPGLLPAATVARTIYHGDYGGLAEAWGQLHAWMDGQQLSPAEHFWEVYLEGPESGREPSTWRTQLNRPVEVARPTTSATR